MPAKKSAKKAAKKAAKKITSVLENAGAFDAAAHGADTLSRVAAALKTTLERRKGREVNFQPHDQLYLDFTPVSSIYLQWALDMPGIPFGITNIVAKDGLGKSTLTYNLLSEFLKRGCLSAVFVGDDKVLPPLWAMRALSTDPMVASSYLQRITVSKVALLDAMAEEIKAWALAMRDPAIGAFPIHLPLVGVVDPYGKLATKAQAAGIAAYAGYNKEKESAVMDKGHSWDMAKWSHDFTKRVNVLRKETNMHLFLVEHQNQKDPAGEGGMSKRPTFAPKHTQELSHRTKPGGEAINAMANLQMVLTDKGKIYSAGEPVARRILIRAIKNSNANNVRLCAFALKGGDFRDENGYLDQGIRWDYTEVEWLASEGLCGFRKTGASLPEERYSSDVLSFQKLSLEDAAQAWREAPQAVRQELGEKLSIPGYVDHYARIMSQLKPDQDNG